MKKTKRNLMFVLSLGLLACGLVGTANLYGAEPASADVAAKFEMASGASVRLAQTADDKSGIRWETTITSTYYDALNVGDKDVEVGVLVAPEKNIVADAELTVDTAEVDSIPCTKAISFDANGEFTYYSSIVYDSLTDEQALKAYAVELTARAYIKVGDTYTYVEEYDTTRSMRAVAYEALNHGYTQQQVGKYFGTVQENTGNSGYYSEMDVQASLTNIHGLANGTYSASVKAQPVSVVVNDSALTVTGDVKGLTAGENYKLNVFDASNNVYVQDFTYVTLAIDEATDLDYFYLGKRAATGSEWTKDDVFAGYYVLVKNINCKNYVFGQAKEEEGVTPANLTNPSGIGTANLKNVGLTGTFDGQGYSITNFTPNGAGLFAAINGGTLKNISISSPSSINSGGGFLCTMMRNATLQNVNLNAGTMIIYGTVGISKYILDSTLKNCVFQASSGAERNWGGLVAAISGSTFENCYAIYNYALSAGLSPKYDASNQNDGSATGVTWLDGIKRYNKVSEIQADAANNDYSSFDATYWDLTSGMPVWKAKN